MNEQLPVPPSIATKTCGLAIASLVLGILGTTCVLPLIGPIIALILGIMATSKIKKSGGVLGGSGMAIAGIVLGAVGLVMIPVMAGMLLPALSVAREKARRVQCMNNEKQIALAYMQYTSAHNGQTPRSLDDLRELIGNDKALSCPSARDNTVPSYHLVAGTKAEDIIVRENPENHRGVGENIAYGDGHAAWLSHPTNNR